MPSVTSIASSETALRTKDFEEHLCTTGSEFGDSAVILGRVTGILDLCLEVVADAAGLSAFETLASLPARRRRQLVLEPVNRRSIQDAFDAVCANATPTEAWDEADGWAVTAADPRAVEAAEALLAATVPQLWDSVRCHIRQVVDVAGAPFNSGSDRRLPGTVMVASEVFGNPGLLSEALLHEGVHQKLYDLYLQAPILEPGYDPAGSPRLRPPWHGASQPAATGWPVDNVLAAMHVYAHLTVLRARQGLEWHGDVGPPYASALSRAVHLAEALRSGRAGRLGPSGTALVEWLWRGLTAYAAPALEARQ